MITPSNVAASSLTSWVFAPLMTIDKGRSFSSANKLLFATFFPRSVGFLPADSNANEALIIVPSKLYHSQAIPSSSSYSNRLARQSCSNNPIDCHSRKYSWIELLLPYSLLGTAFHWHPVRRHKEYLQIHFADPGVFCPRLIFVYSTYRNLFCHSGISGSTLAQKSSETL